MNQYETYLVQSKYDRSQLVIRNEMRKPKAERDVQVINKAKLVATTTQRWLREK